MNTPGLMAGILFITAATIGISGCKQSDYENIPSAGREPLIEPDYSAVTIPKNIAPMNFMVLEDGNSFIIRVKSASSATLTIKSAN